MTKRTQTIILPGTIRDRCGQHAVSEDDHPQPQSDARLSKEAIIVNDALNTEEREILEKFEEDALCGLLPGLNVKWG